MTFTSRLLIVYLCLVQLQCEVYEDRPKIKSADGDLILEPAYGKNIYIRPNGPKSKVFVGDVNVLNINMTSKINTDQSDNQMQQEVKVPQDLLQRLDTLETFTSAMSNNLIYNVTYLTRRINNLNNRIRILQNRVNTRIDDECQSNPCENGGTCLSLPNGYYCLCPSTWKGRNCDEDVNECRIYAGTDLGCQNGARCINKPGSYECLCTPGWYGLDCTRKAKDCSGGDYEMCGHGTCIPVTTGDGIKCICNQGWTTNETHVACLTDINECKSGQGSRCSVNPRVECINLPGSFICGRCPPGYEGDGFTCYDIDECITIPNGGCSVIPMVSCHNTIGSRICGSCPLGYQGDGVTCNWRGSCAINHGGCHPAAKCMETSVQGSQVAQCVCPYGMTGDGVGIHGCYFSISDNTTEKCENNPCGNHGHCHPLPQGYTCICQQGYSGTHCEKQNNFCSNNPCLNGGTCRLDDQSSKGFRCECTALYTGSLCESHSQPCGGVLDAEEGSITYPMSNSSYINNARCAWVIRTVPDMVINVTFTKFNLEYHTQCHYDFVQIHDGRSSASQLIGRFCGNDFPNGGNIISSHNNLYFWFRSDSTVAKSGFALHWTSIPPQCGGKLNASTHGHISSPGSPGPYPPNRDCYWLLETTLGKRISIHFFQLDIEVHANCSYDYIAIYDGARTSDVLNSKYCNSTQPAPVQSAGSVMLIHFHSDGDGFGKGFQISYAPVEGTPGCGGLFTNDIGEITSPSFNGSYLNNLLCEYKIITNPEYKIGVEFVSFDIERSFMCKYDYLKVYDGASEDSPLVGKFCGQTHPASFTSSSNSLYIIFKSDHTMAKGGFKLQYKTICHRLLEGDSGIIKSPGYPLAYPEQTMCEYIIGTSPGIAIRLTFQDFDIEDNRYYNCSYDYVEVRDGPAANSKLMGRFCGGSQFTPPVQISSYNYMYIKFHSDMTTTGAGFYANYTTIHIECGGIYKDTTGVINHPANGDVHYQNDQSCTWIVLAPEGMHIKLTWNRFDLEELTLCSSDYVELIEFVDGNYNNTIGKYCGDSLPPAMTITSNIIMIKFISDSSIRSEGFSLSYEFLDEKTYCGGFYVKTHGFIYTPGWPAKYEPNRDCTWTISVPKGQQVVLNISDFDLEKPLREKCDFGDHLTIRDGSNDISPLIGIYCGTIKTKKIISTSQHIYLHFHSDYYISGKGFKIEWDGTIRGCGGTLNSYFGSISSPNYPQNYDENSECFYKIVTSSGSRIQITFIDLSLERSTYCWDDYVEIFDGQDSNTPSLGKYCTMPVKPSVILTSSNYAFIKFRSDFSLTNKGFLLNYNTICNINISGSYGVIESPGFPDKYPLNSNCLWTINVPKGNVINITFTNFDLIDMRRYHYNRFPRTIYHTYSRPSIGMRPRINYQNCEFDYVQFKDTSIGNFSQKFCGSRLPRDFTSQTDSVQIKFVAQYYYPSKGFRLEWFKHGCGNHIQRVSGSISFDGIKVDEKEIECEWLLETPIGTSVRITISDFYIAESSNCTTDAIEIYNGQDMSFPLLTRICHRDMIVVQATSNVMLVRLVKRSSLRNIYLLSRFDSNSPNTCGGNIKSQSGLIYSKNYPNNYDNNIDCIWFISVPKHHRIELTFLDLDLYSNEDEVSECKDSLKIYDGGNILNFNYSNQICPQTNVSTIVTKHSRLAIQFTTDSYGAAKGFKANFTMICGAVIEANRDGVISNNNYINLKSRNCTWTILSPYLSDKIKLTIQHLSLPRNTDIITNRRCPSSFLKVLDGDDEKSPLIDEFCGSKVPPTIVSHGSALTVQLGTYTNIIDGQFSAHYTTISTACGGELTSEEGTIASPNYPQSYPNNIDCEWIVKTSPGNRVYITFEYFDLMDSEGCNEDYLEVRENNGGGNLIATYCGNDTPTNTTTASKLYIKFHTDSINTGRGFLLHYGFLHGNDIIGLHGGEIASPLYPHVYNSKGFYTWRITTKGTKTIAINVHILEIPSHSEVCYSKLIIYDGYDEEAPMLKELCGIFKNNIGALTTSSNVAYIKLILEEANAGALFYLEWTEINRDVDQSYPNNNLKCGSNVTRLVRRDDYVVVKSPNYPEEYENNLNCEWIFQSEAGNHLVLHFDEFKLEEMANCMADSVSIYSSNSPLQWTPITEHMCLSQNASVKFEASRFMKITFTTDQSITKRGFKSVVSSVCGGLLEDASGIISDPHHQTRPRTPVSSSAFSFINTQCDWILKVRPGRTIMLKFVYFNLTNDDKCNTYIILKNGGSVESPSLGDGKYCGYEHENRTEVISSSNYMFIRYASKAPMNYYQTFVLRYEEKNIVCGITSLLDSEHSWEIISSPNYPRVPIPYTECIWIFTGPPGEILRIDFIDRFDLYPTQDCNAESIEVRDGSTRMSPLKGIFCKQRPGTIKSTSNTLFIKYATYMAEPRNGFKANVSVDICGATIVAASGEIVSPTYPHMMAFSAGTVCEWHIISVPGHAIKIAFTDIDIPESEKPCETKITIEETIPADGKTDVGVLKEFCDNADLEQYTVPIETITNKVVIKLHFGIPGVYTQVSKHRGFKFTFNSSRTICGGKITTSEGYVTTPGYPRSTSLIYCQWVIVVPDESRRIRLEIEDMDPKDHLVVYNDLTFSMKNLGNIGLRNSTEMPKIYESSGNIISFYLYFVSNANTINRFKAKFSSESPALCGGRLDGIQGELTSPDLPGSYVCEWQYSRNNFINNAVEYKTIYVLVDITASSRNTCRYFDSKIQLRYEIGNTFTKTICGNNTQVSYRMPSDNFKIKAMQYTTPLHFNLKWKLQPCGGVVKVNTIEPINILNLPDKYNESIECGWLLQAENGIGIELKLEGTFNLDCSEEYIKIEQGQNAYVMVDYCKDKMQTNSLILTFRYINIQYHSNVQSKMNIKLMVKRLSVQCGGILTKFERVFTSPNYPQTYQENQECSWEIQTDLGYRVSLQFIERFVIEDRKNCTKDVVIVYDWKDNNYNEIARLCGRNLPPKLNSTYNRMKVVFRSDDNINLDGFKATWNPICGGNFIATEKEQFVYSPGYSIGYYASLNCHYEISASVKKAKLTFSSFEIEGPYPDCPYDNLTISSNNNFDYFNEVYCGNKIPPPVIFDKAEIDFKTDKYGQRSGFKISYSTYACGGHVKDPQVITLDSSDNANCTWSIESPPNKVIILKLSNIEVESNYDCYSDYIAIYEGPLIDYDKRVALICGHINSTTAIKSKGNKMILQFMSENSYSKGFRAEVLFSYSNAVGCGGDINLTDSKSQTLKSPLLGNAIVYENYLDCHWNIKAPLDHFIKVSFSAFHIAPCLNVNQTALGYNKCDCDYVELKDGLNPNSLVIGTICGHNIPPEVSSSSNVMSIRLSTDGDITSSGFEATLSAVPSTCGKTIYTISNNPVHIKSPGYGSDSIPRGVHCSYYLDSSFQLYSTVYVHIKNLDIQPGIGGECNEDRLVVYANNKPQNITTGKDFIWNDDENDLLRFTQFTNTNFPKRLALCGRTESIDFYFTGSITINIMTTAELTNPSTKYKGVDIEVAYVGLCGRNYSESQGRIQNVYGMISNINIKDCYTLITAPENFTIAAYFIAVSPAFGNDKVYLEIFDGNVTSSPLLLKISKYYKDNEDPVFSSGRYLLLHNHLDSELISFDLNYVTSDRGKGCGGKLHNILGKVTSPLYPEVYRKKTTCEWELETPPSTRLRLHFSIFDLGKLCDQNYVSLVNRNGDTISTYCSEVPADYTSPENYVKIVFTTTMNNGGTGWVAEFMAVH